MREAIKVINKLFEVRRVGDPWITGAEIGVYLGGNARDIFNNVPHLRMHLVEDLSEMHNRNDGQDWVPHLGECLKGLDESLFTWHVKTSAEASREVKDGSLEFCYIDANHSYEYVMQDCRLWWPKVKIGGLLCGHDFLIEFMNEKKFQSTQVKDAVEQFSRDMNLEVHHNQNVDDINTGHSGLHDWWLFKNV